MEILENFNLKNRYSFADLVTIVRTLRAPGGCPWDREQTHESIRNSFIEEAYEAVDAIDHKDMSGLCEELGDVLLQVIFHAQIAEDSGNFDLDMVCDGICKKLIYRHPHVFADVQAETSAEVLDNWDKLKRKEKCQETYTDTLNSVPMAFPALMRAQKVQKRAAKAGLDCNDISGPMAKLSEELDKLKNVSATNTNIEDQFGDLLFTMVNLSRFLKLDAEETLAKATDKFIARFSKVEKFIEQSGRKIDEVSPAELDSIWDNVN